MDFSITSNYSNTTNMQHLSHVNSNVESMLKQLGYSVEGKVIDIKNNRIILDNNSKEYLDISLKNGSTVKKFNSYSSSFEDIGYASINKGDMIEISPASVLDIKSVPKSSSNQDTNINDIDLDQQTLYSYNLPLTNDNIEALNILKNTGMPITKEGILSIANLIDKVDFIIDNASSNMVDTIANLYDDAGSMNIDLIVSDMKKLVDSSPLSQDEINNIDIESVVRSLGSVITDPALLKNIVSSIIKNGIPPTKNNVSNVGGILADIKKIKNVDGKTIGYVVKNKISITINNLLKTQLSFNGLSRIVSPSSSSATNFGSSISKSDIDDLVGDIKKVLSLNGLDASEKNIDASKLLIENEIDVNKDNVTKVTEIIDDVSAINKEITPDITCKLIKNGIDIRNTDLNVLLKDIDKVKAGISIYDNNNDQTAKFFAPRMSLDSKKSENNLKSILVSMNVTFSKENLTAAKILINAGIDISEQTLKKAVSLLQNLNSLNSINSKNLPKLLSYIVSDPDYMVNKNNVLQLPINELINKLNAAVKEIDSKNLWQNIQINTSINFDEFESLLKSSAESDYKALGFMFRNNMEPTLVNINRAQEILMAKSHVKLNSSTSNSTYNYLNNTSSSVDITTTSDNSALSRVNNATAATAITETMVSDTAASTEFIMPKNFSQAIVSSLAESLKPLLSKMGLDTSDENINIAKALIQNTIALDKQKILEISDIKLAIKNICENFSFIDTLPESWENIDIRKLSSTLQDNLNNNSEYISNKNYKTILSSMLSSVDELSSDVATFMLKNNIPFTLKNIYGTKMFLDNKFLLGKQLGELQSHSAVCNDAELKSKAKNILDLFMSRHADFSKLKSSPEEFFERISSTAKDIFNYVNTNSVTQSADISKIAYDINLNLELQDKFNLYNTLIQVPINMNNQAANLQIYVMHQNKGQSGNNKLDENNLDVFLHLNTESMGTVDTFLNFKNKHLTLRVNVENEDAKKLMKDNTEILTTPLSSLGFNDTTVLFFSKYSETNILSADNTLKTQLMAERDGTDNTTTESEINLTSDIFNVEV